MGRRAIEVSSHEQRVCRLPRTVLVRGAQHDTHYGTITTDTYRLQLRLSKHRWVSCTAETRKSNTFVLQRLFAWDSSAWIQSHSVVCTTAHHLLHWLTRTLLTRLVRLMLSPTGGGNCLLAQFDGQQRRVCTCTCPSVSSAGPVEFIGGDYIRRSICLANIAALWPGPSEC